jgi:peroxiredoxin
MSLSEALRELAQASRARRPAEAQAVIDAALERLRASGLAQSSLQPGEMAPDFELPDTDGRPVSLEATLRNGPAVVTFYRGGWCPYCNLALRALHQAMARIRAAQATLIAITPQLADGVRETRATLGLDFPMLTDRGNKVSRLFGLAFRLPDDLIALYRRLGVDLAAANGMAAWELPLPATYVVAPDGNVAYAMVDVDYTRRAEPDDVLAALERLQATVS